LRVDGAGRTLVRSLAAFELRRIARSRTTLLAGFLFAAVLALGQWAGARSSSRGQPDGMFGYAYLLVAFLTLRFRLATDRETCLDEYLTANFVSPGQYLTGKVIALAGYLLALGVYAFGVAAAMSWGDIRYALWYAVLFTLVAWVFAPLVGLVEALVATRVPAIVVALAFVSAAVVMMALGSEPEPLLDLFGLHVQRFEYGSLGPLTVRATVAVPAGYLLLYSVVRRRLIKTRGGAHASARCLAPS
jgi:hypothetical protein